MAKLAARGWKPDYISIRKRVDLQPPSAGDLAQAKSWLCCSSQAGFTRLIDNLELSAGFDHGESRLQSLLPRPKGVHSRPTEVQRHRRLIVVLQFRIDLSAPEWAAVSATDDANRTVTLAAPARPHRQSGAACDELL